MNKINPSIEFGMLGAFMDNVLRMVTAARTCKNVAITFTRERFMSNGDTECNMVQSIEIKCPSLDDIVGMFGVCRTVKEFCACAWYGDTMPRRVACEVIDPEEDDCGNVPDKRIILKVSGARY